MAYSPEEWAKVEVLLAEGIHTPRAIEQMTGISASAIRKKYALGKKVRESAQPTVWEQRGRELAIARANVDALPHVARNKAYSLADRLASVADSLSRAAEHGSRTAARLLMIAEKQASKIDENNPMDTQQEMQAVSVLTKIANEAGQAGYLLINAARQSPAVMQPEAEDVEPLRVEYVNSASSVGG